MPQQFEKKKAPNESDIEGKRYSIFLAKCGAQKRRGFIKKFRTDLFCTLALIGRSKSVSPGTKDEGGGGEGGRED